jgi:cell division GTPase FtsZ
VAQCKQDILHLARQTFGTEVDHIMVCVGAGGGTGGGGAAEMVDIAKAFARSIGKVNPAQHVGVVAALPTLGEASSPQVGKNAHTVVTELGEMAEEDQFSPLIIVDNEKVSKMYPGMTVRSFWPSINGTVSGLFDVFNRLTALSSEFTTFDPVDYQSILKAGGCCIMGLTKVTNVKDKFALSEAVRSNLEKTLLSSGFDLSTAKVAGCIVVGGKKMMDTVAGLQDNINFAFDVLADITGNATIHRGIYEDSKEVLRVYTIIGGLDFPEDRIEELITP